MMHKTKAVFKVCPTCEQKFAICPQGKFSRTLPRHTQTFCSRDCANKARYRRGRTCAKLATEEAAYIAGFTDADGSIFIYADKRSGKYRIRVTFSNARVGALDWIATTINVGSRVTKRPQNKRHRTGLLHQVNADAAYSLLVQIQPFLVLKQAQARLAIDFQERMRDPSLNAKTSWQREYYDRMQAMNRRGT